MENIKFNSIIVEVSTKDGYAFYEPHGKNIAIAEANLSDFNNRMNTNVVLEYNHNDYKFKLISSHNPKINRLAIELSNLINRYVSIVKQFDETFILNEYVEKVKTLAFNLSQEIRRTNEFQNGGLTSQQKGEYVNFISEFIVLYKDSYPKVILSDKEKIDECKNKVNEICLELSKEFVPKNN